MNPMIISVACVASVSVDGIFCPKNPISVLERKKKKTKGKEKCFLPLPSPLAFSIFLFFIWRASKYMKISFLVQKIPWTSLLRRLLFPYLPRNNVYEKINEN